ncbi:16S rRNA (uracil1498-N3)-methyltransferase [Acinetobacter marinus]|uniref:Ribosomal RNA small subunit methyltransferase E n=1 Tax=Acinetobacter marinus TaxID=281375 RepID=A0A1G6JU93_9GAMM|nr:16S rRNA (uracil(1498)-N(3))-methyltransferase [Acinetobacter marinus]SDC22273.1 16S rRNA (uracil1498-N3)-methyltransferase [Acinetobacter marinus]
MNRFYMDHPLAVGEQVQLSETVFHHWVRVLRAKVTDQAILFNGLGGEYLVELTQIEKKSASIQVLEFNPENRNLSVKVTLGQVMSKGDRMDYAIQKATELGVSEIQLLTSERCEMRLKYERDQKKIEHWQGVAIAACEQCGLNIVPKTLAPLALTEWIESIDSELKLIMTLADEPLQFSTQAPESIALLVGPEGGLSQTEIDFAQQQQFQPWTIGKRVLRTETAPIVALSVINQLYCK